MPGRRASRPAGSPSAGASLLLFPEAAFFQEDPAAIRQISCKRGCLAVVKTDGTVVVWDRAEEGSGQSPARKPRHINLKKKIKVDLLDCETSHLLILSSEGKLSEHSLAFQNVESKPRLLKELGDRRIVQIACGDHHSMALSKGGELFAWGQNEYGQLGVGREMSSAREPQLVQALEGIPLAKIAAGGFHSMAVSLSGSVYSWGKNAFGQLGLGNTEDRHSPTYVNALEHKKTVFVSCGGEHTAVLSKDGLVCTFGAGCYGQLGHNSTRNEMFPRLVAELFSARVSKVACGRWHTLVYVPDLKKVYSFGSGSEGQLGNGRKCNQLIPFPVDLVKKGKKFTQEGNASEKQIKIIAGDNQSIVISLKEKNSYANLNRTIATLEEEETDKWVSNLDPNRWPNIRQEIKLIFSSVACVNGSFLKKSQDEHFRTSQGVAGINMSAVLLFSDKIVEKPKVYTEVMKAVKKLVQSLLYSATSPEALRVFLILPVILRKEDLQSDSLLCQLAQAIMSLQPENSQMLKSLLSNLNVPFFKDLVDLYRRLSSFKLSSIIEQIRSLEQLDRHRDIIYPMFILQVLYEVNCRTGFRIQEKNFYIPEVKKMLHPPKWKPRQNPEQMHRRICSKLEEVKFPLYVSVRFPCILDTEAKILLHDLDRHMLQGLCSRPRPDAITELHVRRQHLLQDTWVCIRNMETNQFQHFLKVCFIGEPGIDDGGPSQEFFSVLRRELCAPEAQIFQHFEESHLIWFSSQAPAQEDIYVLIGTVFGMALYNMKIAAFPFPLALFKKMANIPLTLEDLKELSPIEGRCLQAVLDEQYDDILESMMLDFTVMKEERGSKVFIELKENGANIPVTKYNRNEYVDAYVNYIFNDSVEKQFVDFMSGFLRGCPARKWKIFLPVELQVVLHGRTEYNWKQLEKNARYHGYEESDETIKNFWAVFHELPEEKKKDFLAFLTGTNCVPSQGMERFALIIEDARKENPDRWYPVASTCFRVLSLPRYSNQDILREMFLSALEHYEKFGLS
ncbi:probable E3 ubiquitin-protein ligase HERC4 [Eublepharis macularius]|uniref:Probable E3 ubiquitin-protein ligase HERC4 n=1 Tax=Eublepharis macularius TaxID=481883 RepID=A0AA97K0U3_EUBMA|nr:probable E3 ubiquitin-protein ligase HERC4 [Eublepharis macularius]